VKGSLKFADVWLVIVQNEQTKSYRDVRLVEELQYIAGNDNHQVEVLVNADDISE
jgi:hypothetical protein